MGPNAVYSKEQLAIFAAHREDRAACRPRNCRQGPRCWVEKGPAGWVTKDGGFCIECCGIPGHKRTSYGPYVRP